MRGLQEASAPSVPNGTLVSSAATPKSHCYRHSEAMGLELHSREPPAGRQEEKRRVPALPPAPRFSLAPPVGRTYRDPAGKAGMQRQSPTLKRQKNTRSGVELRGSINHQRAKPECRECWTPKRYLSLTIKRERFNPFFFFGRKVI